MKRPALRSAATKRWLLLGVGIVSILGLTLMNVFSLWQLHQMNLENSEDVKRAQLRDVRNEVYQRIYRDLFDLRPINVGSAKEYLHEHGRLPENLMDVIRRAGNDTLFKNVYFTKEVVPVCEMGGALQVFDREIQDLRPTGDYDPAICEGLEIVRSRTRTLLNGSYRWNTRNELDGSRSINVALIDAEKQSTLGYLSLEINNAYLVGEVVAPILEREFGANSENGMTVWVWDWSRDEVLATNDRNVVFDRENVSIRERMIFETWGLQATINQSPTILEAKQQFVWNLVILGLAVVLLISSVVFIFRTSTRERELAQRQAGFLANVTHELKTPLAVMQAAGENLADGRVRDPDRLANYGRHIHEEALRLSRMIDKLLNVARSDAGEIVIHRQPVRLSEVVQEFIDTHQAYFTDKKFEVRYQAESDDFVNIDVESFQTILTNLVENAIKYSDKENKIDIRVYRVQNRVVLDVEDYGVGIPTGKQKFIFDKFYRVEDPLTAKTKGHGLGLSIVKFLATLNDGAVSLRSVYGAGSVFMVSFPVWNPAKNDPALKQPETRPEYAVQG